MVNGIVAERRGLVSRIDAQKWRARLDSNLSRFRGVEAARRNPERREGPLNSWMNDLQTQMRLKWLEVLIAVKQRMSAIQTECCDEAINRFANRDPALPQEPVILRRGHGDVDSPRAEYLEFQEIPMHVCEDDFIADSLQHLAKDQVGQPQALVCQFSIQPEGVRVGNAS